VSQSFADDLDRHAGLEEQGRMGVSQVMEPNPGQAGSMRETPLMLGKIHTLIKIGTTWSFGAAMPAAPAVMATRARAATASGP
jgi:hypothetical protein